MPNARLAEQLMNERAHYFAPTPRQRLDAPLLVIGLGGAGIDALKAVKAAFDRRFVNADARTAYLALDSDHHALRALAPGAECIDLSLGTLGRPLGLRPWEQAWFDPALDNPQGPAIGSGGYRQMGRLMLSRRYPEVRAALFGAISRITAGAQRLDIVIAAGLGGGTGSGTFLDTAQILRDLLRKDAVFAALSCHITGCFVMPDVMCSRIDPPPMVLDRLMSNGFAALKELDCFMRDTVPALPYTMRYGMTAPIDVDWIARPFDACVLLCAQDANGIVPRHPYDAAMQTIAETLLSAFAGEDPAGFPPFSPSPLRFETDLRAQAAALPLTLPAVHGYSAIGAHTLRVPTEQLRASEYALLLSSFMPLGERNALYPTCSLLEDGFTPARARTIIGDLTVSHHAFLHACPFPPYLHSLDPHNREQLHMLRVQLPHVHDQLFSESDPWLRNQLIPTAKMHAQRHLRDAWGRFESFCREIIADPQMGPFALRAYLTDPKGLLCALKKELEHLRIIADQQQYSIRVHYDACTAAYPCFMRPPLLGAMRAVNGYFEALGQLRDAIHRRHFLRALEEELRALSRWADAFTGNALIPLCDALHLIHSDLRAAAPPESDTCSALFPINLLQPELQPRFREANADGAVTRGFLDALAMASFDTTADHAASDPVFIFGHRACRAVLQQLERAAFNCFHEINSRSADSAIDLLHDAFQLAPEAYADQICRMLRERSTPLLGQAQHAAIEPVAARCYLSVPQNAPAHIAHVAAPMRWADMTTKLSALDDQVSCTTVWSGLSLGRFAQTDAMARAYASALGHHALRTGLHLVFTGGLEDDLAHNWANLPNPCP